MSPFVFSNLIFSLKFYTPRRSPLNVTIWLVTAKTAINVLGAQAHFSTTQQVFTSSSDMNKQNCCTVFRNSFFKNKHIFCGRSTRLIPAKMAKFFLQVKCEQPRLAMSHLRRLSRLFGEFPHVMQLRSLLVHQSA